MPKTKKKGSEKKRWYTIAYLQREGIPAPGHTNFVRVYKSEKILLEDLVYSMSHELGHRGAYVASVWPGEIGEWEALHGNTKPVYYVYQGGSVEKLS